MKKILIGLAILGVILGMLWPVVVSADFSSEQCERCCYLYDVTKYYRVSHFDSNHDWITERVEAWTAREAGEKLGLRAGYDCFVGYEGAEFEPILNWYSVSYFDDGHNWVTVLVEAESSEDAALQLGLRAGYDCFVGRVLGA